MTATRLRTTLRRFTIDERGNIAIMGAASLLMIIACTALGVDVGSIFADKRRTQSAADLAAIVAASDLTNASRAAAATVAKNNYPRIRSWLSNPVFTRRRRLSRRSSASWRALCPPTRYVCP